MKTLYITDLDGTLLGDDARVSSKSAEIISDLSRRGALISVSTARTPATVDILMRDTYTTVDMVVMTGAAMWNRNRRCFEGLKLLRSDDVAALLHCFESVGVCPFCYALKDERSLEVFHSAPSLSSAEQLFVDQRNALQLKKFNLSTTAPVESYGRMVLFFAMGTYEAIVAVAEHAKKATKCYVSYYKDTYSPDLWLLEIFAEGVSKAEGVARLKAATGADRVVAFGDNLNDIAMLREADVAVAVENALPEVKAVADIVIGRNNDDAVARYIAEDFKN